MPANAQGGAEASAPQTALTSGPFGLPYLKMGGGGGGVQGLLRLTPIAGVHRWLGSSFFVFILDPLLVEGKWDTTNLQITNPNHQRLSQNRG